MIVSKIIIVSKASIKDNLCIEAELKNRGIEPLRWAIVKIEDDDNALISVSYVDNQSD